MGGDAIPVIRKGDCPFVFTLFISSGLLKTLGHF